MNNSILNNVESIKNSGETIDLSEFKKWSISKCNIGNLNDKTAIVVFCVIATIGGKIIKLSNRNEKYNNSLIEKLETIPSYNSGLPFTNFINQIRDIGIVVVGNVGNIAPEIINHEPQEIKDIAIQAIAIELAKGARNIVFDIQLGVNNPLKTQYDVEIFSNIVKKIAEKYNKEVIVFTHEPNECLGECFGNRFEIYECINVLNGNIQSGDFYQSCLYQTATINSLLYNIPFELSEQIVKSILSEGIAYKKFESWISSQCGCLENIKIPPHFHRKIDIIATTNGVLNMRNINAFNSITKILNNSDAGIILHKKNNDKILKGEIICTLYETNENKFDFYYCS